MNDLTRTKNQWKKYILEAHGNTKEAMLEEAKRIYEYQQSCNGKRGGSEFAESVKEWCGLTRDVAHRMAAIGGDPKLGTIGPNLPSSWKTLYEITTLSDEQREALPIEPSLTRAQVKNFKKYGTLEAPVVLEGELVDVEEANTLEEAAMLVPPLEEWGLTALSKRAMEKDRKKIQEQLQFVAKSQSKKFIECIIAVFKYHQMVLKNEIRRQVPDAIEARKKHLDEREHKLDLRERAIVGGINETDRKLILNVLHPDRAPEDMRDKYVKAFKAFKEVAG